MLLYDFFKMYRVLKMVDVCVTYKTKASKVTEPVS